MDKVCEGCIEDRAALQRMKGANKVRASLLGLLLVSALGGNGYFAIKVSAEQTQVALNSQAGKTNAEAIKANADAIKAIQDVTKEQTKQILDAIKDIKG